MKTSEASSCSSRRAPVGPSIFRTAARRTLHGVGALCLLALTAWAPGACSSSVPQDSSSSHWVACAAESDCAAVPAAVACKSGYCVDASGNRVEQASGGSGGSSSGGSGPDAGGTGSGGTGGGSGGTAGGPPAPDAGPAMDGPALASCDLGVVTSYVLGEGAAADCGTLEIGASDVELQAANRCVANAHAAAQPFRLTVKEQGIDSAISTTWVGALHAGAYGVLGVSYDSISLGTDSAAVRWTTCTDFAVDVECRKGDAGAFGANDPCISCAAWDPMRCECAPMSHSVACREGCSLPPADVVEYAARSVAGKYLLVARPDQNWSYEDFRVFYGTELVERQVLSVTRARDGGSTHVVFLVDGATVDAFFPASLTSVPPPPTLTIDGVVTELNERDPSELLATGLQCFPGW